MKQLYKNLTYTLLATSLLCACSSDNDPIEVDSTNDRAINFRSYVGQTTRGEATRGEATPTPLETLYTNGFKVFANKTANDWATNGANSQADFMYDQIITRTGTDINGHWEYSPVKLWPAEGTVSFFAYSPYASELVETSATTWDATGATKLTYTAPATSQAQQDLIAAASFNYTKDSHQGAVDFNFYHTLSRLSFTANTADLADGTSIDISKLAVRYADGKIRHKAVLDLGGVGADMTHSIWSDTATPSYFTAADNNLDAGSVLEGQRLLVIPQDHQEGDIEILVSYTLTTIDDNLAQNIVKEVTDKVIVVPAIQGGWQPNKQYTYNLTITPDAVSFASDIAVSAWDADTTHDAVPPRPKYDIYYSSEEDAFHIGSAEGLLVFSNIVDGVNQQLVEGYTNPKTENIPNGYDVDGILDSDIDLSTVCGEAIGKSWKKIGRSERYYQGHFDGQNHTVSYLYISDADSYTGLFGWVMNGSISNVTVEHATVHGSNVLYLGSLAGVCQYSNVTNCHAGGGLSIGGEKSQYLGGLLAHYDGYQEYALSHCSVQGDTNSISIFGLYHIGGLVSDIYYAHVTNCYVQAGTGGITLTGTQDVAGFLGSSYVSTFAGCYTSGVTIKGESSGAFAGTLYSASHIYGCWANYSSTEGGTELNFYGGKSTDSSVSNCHHSQNDADALNAQLADLNAGIDAYNATSTIIPCNKYTQAGTYGPIW